MKSFARKSLSRNFTHPANRFMGTVCRKTFSTLPTSTTLATMATLGLGLSFLLSYKSGLFHSNKGSSQSGQNSSDEKKSYFNAAPRSISGQHPSYREYAGTDNSELAMRSGQLAVGSIALLGLMYLFGRKK